jgi:hypothetical protein
MTFLSLWNWLKPLHRRFAVCRPRQRRDRTLRTRFVPRLEALEDRTLLSTYTVNTLTDTGAGSGQTGDLRYCVAHATSGHDTIAFAPGLTGTIQLQNDLPILKASVAIQGPGASKLTVAGYEGNESIIFNVGSAATVQIYGLTLANGGYDAIYNNGSVIVSNITFTGDGVYDSGYAIASYGSATVSNSIFSDNNGGVYNEGTTLSVSDCTFSGNYDTTIITGGSATVSDSTFSGNGEGAIANGGNLTVNNCNLSGNHSTAITNSQFGTLAVNNCTISDNSGNSGGGVANNGNLTISNSTISGNRSIGGPASSFLGTTGLGGSTSRFAPAGIGVGGGIYMGGGTLTINSSTIADNKAEGGSSAGLDLSGLAGNGYGGGLYIVGGTVTINNSILAGNLASGGGGYYPGAGYGGGIDNAVGAGALQMHDTILADNTADVGADLYGSVTSLGHNLFGNTTGGSGFAASDLLNVNPQLGPLQNNGGPTQTMALLSGSPAIDAGDNSNAPAYDQRGPGFPRIVGGTIDIGAFEVQNGSSTQAASLVVSGFPSTVTAGGGGTFTVTARNADGSTDTSYSGTVHFTSSDPQAVLPADYTFTAADQGVHTFSATLKTAGTQSITATDTTTSSLTGTEGGITVNPAAASKFVLAAPTSVRSGTPFSLTVTVEDAYGNVVSGYTGTIRFSSTDTRATLHANYTFTAADKGVHTFTGLILRRRGNQQITLTDTHSSTLTGNAIVDVL